MKFLAKNTFIIPLFLVVFTLGILPQSLMAQDQDAPYSFILSWQQDPTSTMTIDWHTDAGVDPVLTYRRMGSISGWRTAEGTTHPFPFSERKIHRVELTGLRSNTLYQFRFGDNQPVYTFRTMPESTTTRPVLFATGGDMMHSWQVFGQVNRLAAEYDIDFVAIGGDFAYADAKPENLHRWYRYLEVWTETMVRPDGRVIPKLGVVGNHEVRLGYTHNYRYQTWRFDNTPEWRMQEAPFFYSLMAFPGEPGYGALDFGNYMSLVFLDTQHTNNIEGVQTQWLQLALANRMEFDHVIPIYHVPAYPSVRPFNNDISAMVRRHFVPLFERQSNISVAFENHDHAYKRTHPLRGGEVSPTGIVYVGDGAWGVGTREPTAIPGTEAGWYMAQTEAVRHFILVEVEGNSIDMRMINERGELFDSLQLNNRVMFSSVPMSERPVGFVLEQNYPNPFNSNTVIRFGLPEASRVEIDIFSLDGRLVAQLADREMQAGWHQLDFNGAQLSSGTYMYRLRAGDFTATRKLMLIK
ncbi:MAG: fibronectin type III domain-containing protein [Bacteroidetes bacterium]|nr:fibronectin type III domain-containing protein [Bacteroidota bacterium]